MEKIRPYKIGTSMAVAFSLLMGLMLGGSTLDKKGVHLTCAKPGISGVADVTIFEGNNAIAVWSDRVLPLDSAGNLAQDPLHEIYHPDLPTQKPYEITPKSVRYQGTVFNIEDNCVVSNDQNVPLTKWALNNLPEIETHQKMPGTVDA